MMKLLIAHLNPVTEFTIISQFTISCGGSELLEHSRELTFPPSRFVQANSPEVN